MNSKVRVILSVIAMSFVMVGCGGGGGSSSNPPAPIIDNSQLADAENDYGYFGTDVMFANRKIVGSWRSYSENSDGTLHQTFLTFLADGEGKINSYDIDYGVSKDGKVIELRGGHLGDGGYIISTTITLNYIMFDKQTSTNSDTGETVVSDCYIVTINDLSGQYINDMCPSVRP